MFFIKIVLILLVAGAVLFLAYSQKFRNLNRFVLVVLFAIATLFIISPQTSDAVANFVGIGKGTDLILYISNAILLLLVAILYAKVSALSVKITRITRNKAIESGKKVEL